MRPPGSGGHRPECPSLQFGDTAKMHMGTGSCILAHKLLSSLERALDKVETKGVLGLGRRIVRVCQGAKPAWFNG